MITCRLLPEDKRVRVLLYRVGRTGTEIFINNEIYELIKEGEIHTLNNTRYILVELPFHICYNKHMFG